MSPIQKEIKENKMMMDNLRHFYLYAKGHYKRSEHIFDDLKKILERYSSVNEKYISKEDVLGVLNDIAFGYINKKWELLDFVQDINPVNIVGIYKKEQSFFDRTAIAYLNRLWWLNVKDIEGDLGKPDPTLLDLKEW